MKVLWPFLSISAMGVRDKGHKVKQTCLYTLSYFRLLCLYVVLFVLQVCHPEKWKLFELWVSLLVLVSSILWCSVIFAARYILRSQRFLKKKKKSSSLVYSCLTTFLIQEIFKSQKIKVLPCFPHCLFDCLSSALVCFIYFLSICSVSYKTVGIDLINAYEFSFLVGLLFCFH